MSEELRAEIAGVLASAGLADFKDTTTRARPQWRASFSFRGELHGETSYVHIYVPAGADQLQVNSTAPSPALDAMPAEMIHERIAEINSSHAPGSAGWSETIQQMRATDGETEGWEAVTSQYVGMEHRMVLTKVRMPLASLSADSVDLAVRLGLHLARETRERLTAEWEAPQK